MNDTGRREVTVALAFAAAAGMRFVASREVVAVVVVGVVFLGLAAWQWPRTMLEKLRSRLATTFTTALFGAFAMLMAAAQLGPGPPVAAIALVAAALALRDRARLAGLALPAAGKGSRVVFEGAAHAIGPPVVMPGSDRAVVAWVARQGRRRWSSTQPFELRSDERRVVVEPERAELLGDVWEPSASMTRAMAEELPELDAREPVRVWQLSDAAPACVIGDAVIENDPRTPTLRDPALITVFRGKLALVEGKGERARMRARAATRVIGWVVVAAAGGALAALDFIR